MTALMAGGSGTLINELELMQSPLVIDKVIRENNLVYKKKWGILSNPKEGEYISTAAFLALICPPWNKQIQRIRKKYGMEEQEEPPPQGEG